MQKISPQHIKMKRKNAEAGAVLTLRPHPTHAAGIIRPTIALNGASNKEVDKREGGGCPCHLPVGTKLCKN